MQSGAKRSFRITANAQPGRAQLTPSLIWVTGPAAGSRSPLPIAAKGDRAIIGRDLSCDLVVEGDGISRQHCAVEAAASGELRVTDLDSRNGTYVNGRAITASTVFEVGDRLRLGPEVVLTLAIEDSVEGVLLRRQRLETLGRLTAGVVHDLNNMLGAISSSTELLASLPGDERVGTVRESAVKDILTAAQRASGLSSELLVLAKGDPRHAPVSLRTVCLDAAGIARRTFEGTVQLDMQLRADAYVHGNHTQLLQAVLNLLVNARDAVQSVGRSAISLRLSEEDGSATIQVRDEGNGIDATSLHRIFEPFFSNTTSGYGVGLSTVRDILAKHGGHVTVETTLGTGTTFELVMPSQPRPERAARVTPAPMSVSVALEHRRVLLVDDEPTVRRSLTRVLQRENMTVEAFASGERAIARLKRGGEPFDLAVLDCDLPGMSGHETIAAMRAEDIYIPVVGVSGHDDGKELQQAGAVTFLVKPFSNAALLAACHEALTVEPT